MIQTIAGRATYPSGKRAGKPIAERTLRAWVKAAESGGVLRVAGAARRADRGKARVIAWREWDRAMREAGVPEDRQREIAAQLDAEVRGLWGNGEASAAWVQFSMTARCQDLARAAGVELPQPAMNALCRMPLHFAGQKDRRRARMNHKRRTNAGGWHADNVRKTRRSSKDLRPMDLVSVDVRHSDIAYRRDDGSLATPKMIAFLDNATKRMFAKVFLLAKGEMIRREHVLVTLREMTSDPAWGLWRGLYLDGGSEFKLGKPLDDLAHLADLVRRIHGPDHATAVGNITSRPHNPQGKIIEGVFSEWTRSIEAPQPGYIGGNRMAKKTHNQGRAPKPMPGGETEILARFAKMVAAYNAKPKQKGHIKGLSPNDAFAGHIEAGWQAIVLDPTEFNLAFLGQIFDRIVQPGGELQIGNRWFAHRKLTVMVGEKARVGVPILDADRAVVLDDKDNPLMVLEPAEIFAMRDRAGARQHAKNRRDATQAAKEAAAGAARMDPIAARNAAVARLPVPVPNLPMATAMVHPVLRDAAELPRTVPALPRREADRRHLRAEEDEAREAVAWAWRDAG